MKFKESIKSVDWATVCTVASCIGVVGTGVLAGLGGAKISKEWGPNDPKVEKAKLVLKHEWPAILCGAITIGLDILGHHLDRKTIAELAAVAGLGAKKLSDYREEVADRFGPDEERDISERLNQKWSDEGVECHLEELVHTFYEPTAKRYFDCPTSVLYEAVDQLNQDLFIDPYFMGVATLSDLFIRLEMTEEYEDDLERVGWYAPYVPGGMLRFSLEFKRDPLGKKYWIIHWDRGCQPMTTDEIDELVKEREE